MKPVIALVGRPNVGKSTLFNRLTRSRQALVADIPGLTRDRIYGNGEVGGMPFIAIDTAGLARGDDPLQVLMSQQADLAMQEADGILFLVDVRAGLTAEDERIAARLRQLNKPLLLAVNKAEGFDPVSACTEFYRLGFAHTVAISAEHGQRVAEAVEQLLASIAPRPQEIDAAAEQGIKITVAGRPNVGKSTLVNRMLGEERVLAFDQAGTTRDSIYIPFERDGVHYTLIDTAGVRRRHRVTETVEKISVGKTLQAIDDAHVVILVLDASEGVTDQDAALAGYIVESGRGLVIAVNKWDGLTADQRQQVKNDLDRKLHFLDYAEIHLISALHGTGVGSLFGSVATAYESAQAKFPTPKLTDLLEQAVAQHQPPLVRGRRIKLRYAHQGGSNPPLVVIHGNQTQAVPDTYTRFLANFFRQALGIRGAPLRIEFRSGENPFAGRRNVLTKRQIAKKKRLKKFVARKK